MKEDQEKFNYTIGMYCKDEWECEDGAIDTYAYGSESFFGTMQDAEQTLAYVRKAEKDTTGTWKIFKLVEI